MSPPPVTLVATPSGLYLMPMRPLTVEECEALAEQLAEHVERQRES